MFQPKCYNVIKANDVRKWNSNGMNTYGATSTTMEEGFKHSRHSWFLEYRLRATVASRRMSFLLRCGHPHLKRVHGCRIVGWRHPWNILTLRNTLPWVIRKVHDAAIPLVKTIDPPVEVTSFYSMRIIGAGAMPK
jgi:hypothetical protein